MNKVMQFLGPLASQTYSNLHFVLKGRKTMERKPKCRSSMQGRRILEATYAYGMHCTCMRHMHARALEEFEKKKKMRMRMHACTHTNTSALSFFFLTSFTFSRIRSNNNSRQAMKAFISCRQKERKLF